MDANITVMYQGFFAAFDAVEAKDPELKKKINDWKKRMEDFAAKISDIQDFLPKYYSSGMSEEYATLTAQLYTQDNNTGNQPAANTGAASSNAPTISVRDFLEQYRPAYEEIRKAGYRKRTEKAYENIFAVADRTDDLLEAQIILEKERLLWKIVYEDWLDIFEPILEAIDPLATWILLPNIFTFENYRCCNCEEEMIYRGKRVDRPINVMVQREFMPIAFAIAIYRNAFFAVKGRLMLWTHPKHPKNYAEAALYYRDRCRRMIQLLKEYLHLTYNELAADKRVKPFILGAGDIVPLGRYKYALPPEVMDWANEVINEQIIPDLSAEEFLTHETRTVRYWSYRGDDQYKLIDKFKGIAKEKTQHMTYFKYLDQLSKEVVANDRDQQNNKVNDMMKELKEDNNKI